MPTTTIAIANQKGGVGKTTLTFNLAWLLAERGRKVLAIDLDHQRNLTKGWGLTDEVVGDRNVFELLRWKIPALEAITPVSNHSLIASTPHLAELDATIGGVQKREMRLARVLKDLPPEDPFDYILIDCAPSLGLATLNALYAANQVLIPVSPEQWPIDSTVDFFANLDEMRTEYHPALNILGVVPNLYERSTGQHQAGLKYLAELTSSWNVPLFSPIAKTTRFRDAASARRALSAFDRSTTAAFALEELADRIDAQFAKPVPLQAVQ